MPDSHTAQLLPATADGIDAMARFFRALGDPTRLRLLEFLLHEEHSVTECVDYVGLSQGRVSAHLACLADCGYVQVRRAGRHAYYRVTDIRVGDLVILARTFAQDNCDALAVCRMIPVGSTPQRPAFSRQLAASPPPEASAVRGHRLSLAARSDLTVSA